MEAAQPDANAAAGNASEPRQSEQEVKFKSQDGGEVVFNNSMGSSLRIDGFAHLSSGDDIFERASDDGARPATPPADFCNKNLTSYNNMSRLKI